jgi:cell division protein FtsL
MKKQVEHLHLTKGEYHLYRWTFITLVLTLVLKICCGASVGNLGMDVEKLKYKVENQKNTNESLTMKISELTSFSKVDQIVKDMGLVYNYENIVNIDK